MIRQFIFTVWFLQIFFSVSVISAENEEDRGSLRAREDTNLRLQQQGMLEYGGSSTKLDYKSTVLKSLVSYFTPAVSRTLHRTLQEDMDPLVLDHGSSSHQDLGSTSIGPCNASASIEYNMKVLEGLGTVQLDHIEVVPGSDSINFALLDGATWNVTWNVNASFSNLTAIANASLHIDACGNPMDSFLNGTVSCLEPSIAMEIRVSGETSNLILFQSTSEIVTANITQLKFRYESAEAHLGSFNEMSQIDLGITLGNMLEEDAGALEEIMKNGLQGAIDNALPFRPDSS